MAIHVSYRRAPHSNLVTKVLSVLSLLSFRRRSSAVLWLVGCALLLPLATRANDPVAELPLRVVIVGGGPDLENNQVAIESNVRYVSRLLPQGVTRTALFADGDAAHSTVLFDEDPNAVPVGERVLSLLLNGRSDDAQSPSHYRKPNIGKIDGASRRPDIDRVFTQLDQELRSSDPKRRLLLYFTGHGSPDRRDGENNVYDLWKTEDNLSVRELAREVGRLPADTPIALVMVQCFSGSFGNLIFEQGDPNGKPIDRDFAGFYATVKERVAAGCTSAVNEADYHDFTSYFFAALTGQDRVGRPVTGADYNGDGRIGMDEAFCYTLIHDESIDVPICTSDVFLRRYATMDDTRIFRLPFTHIREWATPAQRAALDALSESLHLHGDDRAGVAYAQMTGPGAERGQDARPSIRRAMNQLASLATDARQELYREYPALKMSDSPERRAARRTAIAKLTREANEGKWKDLLDADDAVDKAELARETQSIAESHLIRFVRLTKSVALAHFLRMYGTPEVKARFEKLVASESRTLLPPVNAVAEAK